MDRTADAPMMHRTSRGVHLVRGQDGADDLDLIAEALREQGPDGTVREPCREGSVEGGTALAAEKAAGDLAGGVVALLNLDGQGEEVDALPGSRHTNSDEDHVIAVADDDCAGSLAGEPVRLQAQVTSTDFTLKYTSH